MLASDPVLSENSLIKEDRTNPLQSFAIYGLFGYQDIVLPLDRKILILIAENGSGKTTVLNSIYYALTGNFKKLNQIDFQEIKVDFASQNLSISQASLKKNDLESMYSKPKPFSFKLHQGLFQLITQDMIRPIDTHFDKLSSSSNNEETQTTQNKADESNPCNEFQAMINNHFTLKLLFFPTYRRIEEDLSSLGYDDTELKNSQDKLIQFGMEDVKNNFKKIQSEIKDTAFQLFSQVTGEMLTQFIEGVSVTQEMRDSIKPDILDIILGRIGEQNISQVEQNKIKAIVSSGEINNNEYDDLVYFLSKLINLYKQQQKTDESIKKFAEVCNKYLRPKKEIVYNESTADIYIKQNRDNQKVLLNQLSSGEKQIISLFSKVYLESAEDFMLIIDEPELSLSVEWQEMLLPDILNSKKCQLLIAATHSPYIFNNDLDCDAYSINEFVTETLHGK